MTEASTGVKSGSSSGCAALVFVLGSHLFECLGAVARHWLVVRGAILFSANFRRGSKCFYHTCGCSGVLPLVLYCGVLV